MGTPDTAAGMRAFCASVIQTETDVHRVRAGLQIAMDGLGQSKRDSNMRRVLLAFHWLLGPLTQQEIADNCADAVESAEWLADYYGPADAGTGDEGYEEWRERA